MKPLRVTLITQTYTSTPCLLHYVFIHSTLSIPCIGKAMAFHSNKSLLSILVSDEKDKQTATPQMESQASWGDDEVPKEVKTMIPPPSPESPWTLSPLRTPLPSPLLVYHCIASLHRGEGNIYSIAISKGVVFTGSDSCRVRAWKQPDCMDRGYLKAAAGGVRAIAASGNMLFTSHRDQRIRVWNFTAASESMTSKKMCSLPKKASLFLVLSKLTQTSHLHKDTISCMAYYHAHHLLYTASHDKTVKVWRLSDRTCVDSFLAHDDKINSLALNQSDGCLFTCSSDATVKIWRRLYRDNSHTLTMTLRFQTSPVNAVVVDAGFLYSGSADGTINFWEKEKQSYRYNHGGFLQGHRFGVLCLAVVEGGKGLVLSGSEDTTVRIWRKEERGGGCYHECLAVLDGHRGPVRCLAGSLEVMEKSFLVYSGSLDQSFKVWRVKLEKKRVEFEDHDLKVNNLYDMNPVLSPSWVEKKFHPNYF